MAGSLGDPSWRRLRASSATDTLSANDDAGTVPYFSVQIFGHESSGKTTLALHAIAEVQKSGGICCFMDVEHAFDSSYAKMERSMHSRLG